LQTSSLKQWKLHRSLQVYCFIRSSTYCSGLFNFIISR